MSTASHLCQRREVSLCFAAQILHSQSTASVKKAGTGWEHWISQITDHLKPPTVAKRCTFLESRKSPALRGFVAGRWELATTSLYPSTKIERSQTARKGVHGGVLSLNSDGPDSRRPTRGPTPPKSPFQGHRLHLHPETSTQGPHGRNRGLPVVVRLSSRSGCGLRPQMCQAAACGKPGALLAPPNGG